MESVYLAWDGKPRIKPTRQQIIIITHASRCFFRLESVVNLNWERGGELHYNTGFNS